MKWLWLCRAEHVLASRFQGQRGGRQQHFYTRAAELAGTGILEPVLSPSMAVMSRMT